MTSPLQVVAQYEHIKESYEASYSFMLGSNVEVHHSIEGRIGCGTGQVLSNHRPQICQRRWLRDIHLCEAVAQGSRQLSSSLHTCSTKSLMQEPAHEPRESLSPCQGMPTPEVAQTILSSLLISTCRKV